MTEMKTLTCPGPPEHEFQIPKGRGRPPAYCEDHKPSKQSPKKNSEEKEVADKPRPRPGSAQKSEPEAPARRRPPRVSGTPGDHPGDKPVETEGPNATMNESGSITRPDDVDGGRRRLPPPGRADQQSRAKASQAHERTAEMVKQSASSWPTGIDGKPMAQIEIGFAELIPTGQYANVSVGPAKVTIFVDLARGNEDMPYFTESEKETITKSANELADMMGRDVIGVQRNLVVESISDD